MENRHGLCVDIRVESATEVTETKSALEMLEEQKEIFGPTALRGWG